VILSFEDANNIVLLFKGVNAAKFSEDRLHELVLKNLALNEHEFAMALIKAYFELDDELKIGIHCNSFIFCN